MTVPQAGSPDAVDPLARRLGAAAIAVYLVILLGAGTALTHGAAACPTWPTCQGAWIPLDDPAALASMLHRLAVAAAGVLLAAAGWTAWRSGASRRVRAAVGSTLVLYPALVVGGALLALQGPTSLMSGLHLVASMAAFSGLLAALAWHLDPAVDEAPDLPDPAPLDADDAPAREVAAGTGSLLDRARAYVALTKPNLMWLLCLVGLAGIGLAAGPTAPLDVVVATMVGGALAVGASGVFNHVLERDADQRMGRTADRPVAVGRVPPRRAVAFGLALAAASTGVLYAWTTTLAAVLGVVAILFYAVVYTVVLKPNTTQNIVLGGAVGAFPALIGWAAVTGTVGLPAWVLGLVIFLWTPPHFDALSLLYADDYARAGIPMLPVVEGEAATRRRIVLYLGATLLGVALLGGVSPRLGLAFAVLALVAAVVFLGAGVRLLAERTEAAAGRTFGMANVYLAVVLAAVLLDTLVV